MRMRLTFTVLKKRKQSITHVMHRNDKSRVAPTWEYNNICPKTTVKLSSNNFGAKKVQINSQCVFFWYTSQTQGRHTNSGLVALSAPRGQTLSGTVCPFPALCYKRLLLGSLCCNHLSGSPSILDEGLPFFQLFGMVLAVVLLTLCMLRYPFFLSLVQWALGRS